jgi:hypothetical protein
MGLSVRASASVEGSQGAGNRSGAVAHGAPCVCKRAGIRELSPHQLRHGFANRFLRESDKDLVALQALMGHSRPDTTQPYTDEIQLDELAQSLARALIARNAQASPDLATLQAAVAAALQSLEWRRRESNPRNVPTRRIGFAGRLQMRPCGFASTITL